MADSAATIAIIGGGPAGAATALSLLRAGDYRVRIFDAGAPASVAIGETIPPATTRVLGRLGLSDILSDTEHLPCSGSLSLWGADAPGHNDYWLDPTGRAFHLDRNRFNRKLKSAARRAGADWRDRWHLRSATPQGAGFELLFRLRDGSEQRQSADLVVDASGQGAGFARRLSVAQNVVDELLCLCAIFALPRDSDMLTHTLAEAVENGWWYAARLPGERVIVAFTSDADICKSTGLIRPDNWRDALHKTRLIQSQLPTAILDELPRLHVKVARSAILSGVTGNGWVAVGDAASSYDPLTSAGITKALLHGELAGNAIARNWQDNDAGALGDYQDKVFSDFRQYLSLRDHLYRSERRFQAFPFWQNRLS